MRKYEELHPLTLFVFFSIVIFLEMFFMDIIWNLVSFFAGLIYYYILIERIEIKKLLQALGFVVIMTLVNMVVSHGGTHIIFFINGRPVTLEALKYGMTTGVMFAGIFIWFLCFEKAVSDEAIFCIFSRMPKFALVFSMILRMIPRYMRKWKDMKMTAEINNGAKDNRENSMKILSGVITYALENSMQTAQVMEMRGFTKPRKIHTDYRFLPVDFLIILFMLLLTAVFLITQYKAVTGFVVCMTPMFFRGKEAVKLWKYNLNMK